MDSAEALFTVDAHQRVIGWNSEATRVFGYTPAAALGAQCYRLVGARDELGRRFCRFGCPVIRAARAGGVAPTLRLSAATRMGQPLTLDVSTIVLPSAEGHGPVIHLCREAAEAPAVATTGSGATLTARERQVLGLLCRGLSTDAIARDLGVSATTVRNHVQRLLPKLAAHSRTEAVALAYREGLFS